MLVPSTENSCLLVEGGKTLRWTDRNYLHLITYWIYISETVTPSLSMSSLNSLSLSLFKLEGWNAFHLSRFFLSTFLEVRQEYQPNAIQFSTSTLNYFQCCHYPCSVWGEASPLGYFCSGLCWASLLWSVL